MTAAASWRPMQAADLPQIIALADAIHLDFPEDAAIFHERFSLFPEGCWIWAGADGPALGYAIAHPWRRALGPPPLNALLGALPARAEQLYIHDVALSPAARGRGAAGAIMKRYAALARQKNLAELALTAVNGSATLWERSGFGCISPIAGSTLALKLASYGADAAYMTASVT